MADYKKMYTVLCKALDEVIDPLENIPSAKQYANILRDALNAGEEIYINTSLYAENPDDSKIIYLKKDNQ